MASAGVSAAAYAAAGDKKQALIAAATIAAAGVGAGVAVKAAQIAKRADFGTKIAAKAWTAGKEASSHTNLLVHFAKHGASMGYRSPLTYTLGAIKNRAIAVQFKSLLSGSSAYRSLSGRVIMTYKFRISSYFKPRASQWRRW